MNPKFLGDPEVTVKFYPGSWLAGDMYTFISESGMFREDVDVRQYFWQKERPLEERLAEAKRRVIAQEREYQAALDLGRNA